MSHILQKVAVLRSPQMCQNWLLMDENEINKVAGSARNWVVPRIKHIRPCQIDGRGDFYFTPLAKGGCHETIFQNK